MSNISLPNLDVFQIMLAMQLIVYNNSSEIYIIGSSNRTQSRKYVHFLDEQHNSFKDLYNAY